MSKKVLILSPHTDDGEFGCGGTISRFIESGADVYYVAFSSCEESLPDGMAKDTLRNEVKMATSVLGIDQSNLVLFNYQVRKFPDARQAILEDMVKLNRDIQPDFVFLPSSKDTHQDHNVVSNEGFRAFKKTSIFGYEMPWNNLNFTTHSFIHFDKRHLNKKIEALQCYQSQLGRAYAKEEFVKGLAVVRGVQVGGLYAEAFEIQRLVIR